MPSLLRLTVILLLAGCTANRELSDANCRGFFAEQAGYDRFIVEVSAYTAGKNLGQLGDYTTACFRPARGARLRVELWHEDDQTGAPGGGPKSFALIIDEAGPEILEEYPLE